MRRRLAEGAEFRSCRFSEHSHNPEVLEAARKTEILHRLHVSAGFVPLIGFPIAGLLMDDFLSGNR